MSDFRITRNDTRSDDERKRERHLRALRPGERMCPRCKGKRRVLSRGRLLGGGPGVLIKMVSAGPCPRCGGRGTLPPR